MALKKSGSRSITVDGQTYRWTFADNIDVWNVTIQSATGAGQKFVLNWSTHPQQSTPQSITPSIVARAIQLALGAGWTPSLAKPELRGELVGDTLKTWSA